jgi:acetyltransferase-like isoleucine patch superfamily enzyme
MDKKMIHFISDSAKLGENVTIWHFSYVGENTEIGDNVTIGSLTHIDYDVKIGNDTKIQGSVYVSPKTIIGNNVFIGPGVIFTNDPYPPSKKIVGVKVEDDVVIGAGSILKAGIRLGKKCVIAMGSIVTKDVSPNALVMGSPAKKVYDRIIYDKKRSLWNNNDK